MSRLKTPLQDTSPAKILPSFPTRCHPSSSYLPPLDPPFPAPVDLSMALALVDPLVLALVLVDLLVVPLVLALVDPLVL